MKKLLLLLTLAFSISANAQDDKTVTLVVSGQGKTQDEAKQNALRSAIEQAFGTFISSKTEILNDNLVKDEIVSVANGNIQKFEIISEVQIPNGGYATSLKATVSVTKLTSFVESKGVVVEFKGNILAANIRQQMLNEQNEIKSIGNIVNTCKEILDLSCDFVIVRGEPKQKNNDNNNWAVPITINVNFNKNIEQFNQYLINSMKGLCMSPDEVLQYKQLEKQTFKIALGGASIGGTTNNIDYIESIAKSNPELSYKIISRTGVVFESDDIISIEREFKKLDNPYGFYKIQYYDKKINPIYHFRTMSTVIAIIDLINYTKHSVLNFQITNGLDFVTPEKLIADINSKRWDGNKYVYEKGYGFKIIDDNLTPIFNSRCNFGNFKFTSNGPNGIFGTYNGNGNTGCGKGPSSVSIYEPFVNYSDNFYYNGGREKSFDQVYNTKYGFLTQVDNDLPADIIGKNYDRSNNGYQAVISLFDFKTDGTKVITFYYEDILSLTDIEKVQEYKIIPILKESSETESNKALNKYNYITDNENLFTNQQITVLDKIISDFEKATSNEIAIVTNESIGDFTNIKEYSVNLANKMGVGKKDKNNGILFVISKKRREIFIATGIETEKILNNSKCQEIISETIIPYFKKNEYYLGVKAGLEESIKKWTVSKNEKIIVGEKDGNIQSTQQGRKKQ